MEYFINMQGSCPLTSGELQPIDPDTEDFAPDFKVYCHENRGCTTTFSFTELPNGEKVLVEDSGSCPIDTADFN